VLRAVPVLTGFALPAFPAFIWLSIIRISVNWLRSLNQSNPSRDVVEAFALYLLCRLV